VPRFGQHHDLSASRETVAVFFMVIYLIFILFYLIKIRFSLVVLLGTKFAIELAPQILSRKTDELPIGK
jgi:hypothetical protein